MMRARGTFSVGGLHYATRSRVRAYEECPESGSAVCRDVRPDGQKRPGQEESDDANWANKGSSKSSGASWAALPRLKGSRQLTSVRFISGLRVISGNAQSDRLTSAFPQKRTSASGQGMSALCHKQTSAALHSITSSARASSVGGTSMPSALAVLRLITSSYLVGDWTGRSAGFSPLRIRST